MSWLADRKATSAASSAVATGAWRGSLKPDRGDRDDQRELDGSSQPRRCPSTGGRSASSAGDQRNLLA